MTEIEKTEGEIKVLQAKLELLKEMEKHKTPCEIAFKRVYGYFPTEPNWDDDEVRWESFQNGYNASKVTEVEPSMINCVLLGNPPDGYVTWNEWYNEMGSKCILHNLKISAIEYQEIAQEPEELKTLYQMFYENDWNVRSCEVFCDIVKEWMSQYADNVMCGEYKKGYEYCLTVLEENLKND